MKMRSQGRVRRNRATAILTTYGFLSSERYESNAKNPIGAAASIAGLHRNIKPLNAVSETALGSVNLSSLDSAMDESAMTSGKRTAAVINPNVP